MTTQTEQQAPALPSPEEAYVKLANDVQAQAFWGVLSDYGIEPRNEAEAQTLLTKAAELREEETVKAASENRFASLLSGNSQQTDGVQYNPAQVDANVKKAAANLAQDPAIYASVVSLKLAEAQQAA